MSESDIQFACGELTHLERRLKCLFDLRLELKCILVCSLGAIHIFLCQLLLAQTFCASCCWHKLFVPVIYGTNFFEGAQKAIQFWAGTKRFGPALNILRWYKTFCDLLNRKLPWAGAKYFGAAQNEKKNWSGTNSLYQHKQFVPAQKILYRHKTFCDL